MQIIKLVSAAIALLALGAAADDKSTLYNDADYKGNSKKISPDKCTEIKGDLKQLGSIKVPRGDVICILYKSTDCKRRPLCTLFGNVDDLTDDNNPCLRQVANRVKSVECYD
ncbi:uncharacterized protein KD926_011682 [Aspergillus affinis]|uniref:uncharacterized protein n=1 Tax=Aspergillus affinis TaxID=1070780 RepID=UPI0022FF2F09|nr:uncharacterized protein KD926_011682 [Aspergillus affinis]KAI9044712.1 hypothetical protein KD926_011682 [Aspergillus affinis]